MKKILLNSLYVLVTLLLLVFLYSILIIIKMKLPAISHRKQNMTLDIMVI